jgi:hypothetical protein
VLVAVSPNRGLSEQPLQQAAHKAKPKQIRPHVVEKSAVDSVLLSKQSVGFLWKLKYAINFSTNQFVA